MTLFLEILTDITLPIIALVALGWAVQPKLSLSVDTLNRLQVNVILPCFLIHFLSTAKIPLADVWPTAWFTVFQFVALLAIGWGLAVLFRATPETRPVIAIALAFPNTGNFGLPLAQLAFPPDYLLHQAVIVSLQSVLIIIAVAVFFMPKASGQHSPVMAVVRSPMIWGVVIGLALKATDVTLPKVISMPIELMGNTYAAIALFALGASLAAGAERFERSALSLIVVLKLLAGPAITWVLASALGFEGIEHDILVVASAAPVGVLLAIFCLQFDARPRLAAAAVFVTTVLSPLFVTGWVLLARLG